MILKVQKNTTDSTHKGITLHTFATILTQISNNFSYFYCKLGSPPICYYHIKIVAIWMHNESTQNMRTICSLTVWLLVKVGRSTMLITKGVQGCVFGGPRKAIMYLDLDCRFHVLRLAQMLRNRINCRVCCRTLFACNMNFELLSLLCSPSKLEHIYWAWCMNSYIAFMGA